MGTVSVDDVAAYILSKRRPITAMKLQKLVYYCQAWSLVWDDAPLFSEPIQAWANGPVVPALYDRHRGQFLVRDWPFGKPEALNGPQRETVDVVLDHYGPMPAQELSNLTHAEDPWRKARKGISPLARSNRPITHASMAEFYSSLQSAAE